MAPGSEHRSKQDVFTGLPLQRALVIGQIVAASWMVFTAQWPFAQPLPATLCLAGILLAVWALKTVGLRQLTPMPAPRPGSTLITRGPYRWIRHPMYTGLVLLCFGLLLTRVSIVRGAVFVALIGILVVKAEVEEQILQQSLDGYADYRRISKRFVPFVW